MGKTGIEPAIRKEMLEFGRLLFSLRDGNKEYGIKGTKDAGISSRLNKHIRDWKEISAQIEKELKTSVDKGWIARYHVVLEDYVRGLDATVILSESKAKGKTSISEIYFLSVFALLVFFAFLFYIYNKLNSTVGQLTKANYKLERTNRLRTKAKIESPNLLAL